MKLLTTLKPSSAPGNLGGELRLFFTVLNPADFQPTPPPIQWLGEGKGAMDTYQLTSGDSVLLNLNLSAPFPGILYIDGAIEVRTKANVIFNQEIGQAPGVSFTPGQAANTKFQGKQSGTVSGVQFDVGFELEVPWDGTSADCHGKWWAKWH
jgi:hypothetical protein